jgi:hypothetical protein
MANEDGNEEQKTNAENLFPLDGPEPVVCFHRNGRVFRHVFCRLTAADHRAHYDDLSAAPTGDDHEFSKAVHSDTADLGLYRRAIQRVEGYRTRDGRRPEELPNWTDRIPLGHRLTAVGLMMKKRGSAVMDSARLAADTKSVSFVVIRDEGELETNQQLYGVAHHFGAPRADHERRFFRALEGGPGAHAVLVRLYDELLDVQRGAEGYSIADRPIAPDQVRSGMDSFHKIFAVCILLSPVLDRGPEPRKVKPFTLPADFLGMRKAAPTPRLEVH